MLLKDLPFHWFFPHSLSWLIHVEGFSSSLQGPWGGSGSGDRYTLNLLLPPPSKPPMEATKICSLLAQADYSSLCHAP